MIFTLISILILLYGFINYKKSLMLFIIYQIFWYSTPIIKAGGLHLNTNLILPFYFCVLFFLNRKKYTLSRIAFPYKMPFIFIIVVYILTCFFALSGFTPEFGRAIMKIFRDYLFIWLLWNVIETKEDFKFLFSGITVVICVACLYGLFEYMEGRNPLLDYKVILSDNTIEVYNVLWSRGYRLVSLFEHPLGAGMTLGLYSIFVLYLWINKNNNLPHKYIAIISAILCLPCIVLTKMRSAIIFLLILAFVMINGKIFKKKRFYYILLLFMLAMPLFFVVISNNMDILMNLISIDSSSAVGGSSLKMRLSQYEAIKEISKLSPWAGLGETFRNYIVYSSYTDAARGYESIWFEQLVMHGRLGVLCHILLLYYSVIKIPKRFKSKEVLVFSLAYWIIYSITSIPSFRIFLLYLAIFYFIKTSKEYKSCIETLDKSEYSGM
ncbi:MAG: O-antigen ligase family protein [Lachnospiraceae bacterium]|nr:O-antigen ligase family protein [Lachnospiraceae bacterium]